MQLRAKLRTLLSYIGLETKQELLGFLGICLVAVVLTNFATAYHWLHTGSGQYYLGYGSLSNRSDINAYLMRIEQGREGAWLFEEWYTPENVPKSAFYTLYLGIGHVARVFDLDARVSFHLARFAVLSVLFCGLYAVLSLFVKHPKRRLVYFGLLLLSNGFSFAFPPLYQSSETISEASNFASIGYAPHFILGLGLMVWFYWLLVRIMRQGTAGKRRLIACVLLFILQGLVYPFALVPMYGTILVFWFLYWLKHPEPGLLRRTVSLLITFLPGLLFFGYYAYVTLGQEFYRNWWWEQQFYSALNPFQFMLGYGICGIFAWIVAVRIVRAKEPSGTGRTVIAAGFFVSFFSYYIPVMYGSRFVIGYQIPLMILAVIWMEGFFDKAKIWRSMIIVIFAIAITSTWYQINNDIHQTTADRHIYLSEEEYGAMEWLRNHESNPTVVLSGRFLGNYIPAVARQKTVLGSASETYQVNLKKAEVYHFYATSSDPGIQEKLLDRYTVSYVVFSPKERVPGGFKPNDASFLRLVYNQPPVQLYQVI